MNQTLQSLDFKGRCPKCDTSLWVKTTQGDIACQLCGIKCSLGYVTYEEEVFVDSENPKQLSRAIKNDIQSEQFLQEQFKKEQELNEVQDKNLNDLCILYFNNCISLFPFNQKDIFLEKNNFEQNLKNIKQTITKQILQQFTLQYFLRLVLDVYGLQWTEQAKIELKRILNIKDDESIKNVTQIIQPGTEDLFVYLMRNLYPNINQQQCDLSLIRLEEIKHILNSTKTTKICVAAYDLLVNSFKQKKVSLDEIAEKASTVYSAKSIKVGTIKRAYNLLKKKENSSKKQKKTQYI